MDNTLILHRTLSQDPAALILPPVVKGVNSLVSTVKIINITSTGYLLDIDKTHETFTNAIEAEFILQYWGLYNLSTTATLATEESGHYREL